MRAEYDRVVCSGWFQCVQKWDAFEMNMVEGKADLGDGVEVDHGRFVLEVPDGDEAAVKAAAESCPVDAIAVYDDGEQIV